MYMYIFDTNHIGIKPHYKLAGGAIQWRLIFYLVQVSNLPSTSIIVACGRAANAQTNHIGIKPHLKLAGGAIQWR